MKKNLILKRVCAWLSVALPKLNDADIPDYAGQEGYDAEMMVYDQIGEDYWGGTGIAADTFKNNLDNLKGKKVLLRIHSPGGNVYDSMAMATAIKDHGNVDTKIDGLAASAAFSIFQMGNKRVMSSYSMGMAHKASALVVGNSKDMSKEAAILDKHDNTIAKLLASRSGKSVEDCMSIMDAETWMDGDEAKANNFCDELTDDGDGAEDKQNKASNLTKFNLSVFKHPPEKAARFNVKSNKNNGEATAPQLPIIMNREQMIALLKGWGVAVENSATNEWLLAEIAKGKPAPQNAAAAVAVSTVATVAAVAATGDRAISNELLDEIKQLRKERDKERRDNVTRRVDACIVDDRWQAANREWLVEQAMGNEEVLNKIEKLPSRPPGFAPVANVSIEQTSGADIMEGVRKNRAPITASVQGRLLSGRLHSQVLNDIGEGAKASGLLVRKMCDKLAANISETKPLAYEQARRKAVCDWLDSVAPCGAAPARMDYNLNGPYGSVDVSSDLQRQVIFGESMRAFRRILAPAESFAHNFGNVPLQGTDTAIVPYYPLYTTASNLFVQSVGYQPSGNDQALSKTITIGGVGNSAKLPGIGRAYQAMTWSAYFLRRQPWIDVQKLVVMRVEQLAYDILNDIINAWILKVNFGNAVWSGEPTAFDNTSVGAIRTAVTKSMWPVGMRNLVVGTDYYGNLLIVPGLYATYSIGDSGVIRDGRVGRLYGFEETLEAPLIPQTTDGNLVGWAAWPSAVLVATAPILPGPGEMKQMVNYDVVTDDQIGLSFEYKYFGAPLNSQDYEIVECNYGSGLGEQAALKRIVSSGT